MDMTQSRTYPHIYCVTLFRSLYFIINIFIQHEINIESIWKMSKIKEFIESCQWIFKSEKWKLKLFATRIEKDFIVFVNTLIA